ncbi:Invasin, domain 3 [Pseudomonas putida]|nr:Invasin, domain 3 [Pseudomonas putida]CAB5559059.1 Invasin, domain 3 [Pseudomonas putida]CAB5596420.1 Invasin, domain 3 [Pseudomonas putida]CAB5598498.1 Invasin, domain 3 [Pseudomonas putida]CAB5654118.1 Invasin, domain 3 [Pseudomonas putida]
MTLTPDAPDASRSSFAAAPTPIEASGSAYSVLTFTAMDAKDNPVTKSADKVTFSVKDSSGGDAGSDITVTEVKETSPGVYEAKLSGTKVDTWTVRPVFEGAAVGSLSETVTLTPGAVDDGTSDFTANPISIIVGTGESGLTLTAKDAHGNLIPGIVGDLEFEVIDSKGVAAGADVTIKDLQETTPGIYTAKLSGTRVEIWSVTPMHKKMRLGSLTKTVELKASAPISTFTANPTRITLLNPVSTLTLEAKDADGMPMTGIASRLKFVVKSDSNGNPLEPGDVHISDVKETATAGTYTATFITILEDDHKIIPTLDGADMGTLQQIVTLPPSGYVPGVLAANSKGVMAYLEPERLFKGAEFHFVYDNKFHSEIKGYNASTKVSWLSKTSTNDTSFKVTDIPDYNYEMATIEFKLPRGTYKFHHTIRPQMYYIPSKEKLPFDKAEAACKSQGYLLTGEIKHVSNKWGILSSFSGSDFKPDLYWQYDGSRPNPAPALFNVATGQDHPGPIDPNSEHYYVCSH